VSAIKEGGLSERRACKLVALGRSSVRYQPHNRGKEDGVEEKLRDLAMAHKRYGYRRLGALLRRQGHTVNHKRVYRLYCVQHLAYRRKRPGRKLRGQGPVFPCPTTANVRWSMDFVSDVLRGGRKVRILNVVDDGTRECLSIESATNLPGHRVVRILDRIVGFRGKPSYILMDNGPEFRSRAMEKWAAKHGVQRLFIEPGKPSQNAYIESFNGKFRDECLNESWFIDMRHLREVAEGWRQHYNHLRPHSSLGYRTPTEYREATTNGRLS